MFVIVGKCCGPRPQPREYEEISSHISDTPDDTSLLHERSVEMSADRVSSVIQPSVNTLTLQIVYRLQ